MKINKKIINNKCYKCDGKCHVNGKKCDTCNETGIWKEHVYYFIDEKNKIAFDSDNLA